MRKEERGAVVEVRGSTALVRLTGSPSCSGCPSSGQCHAVRGGDDRLLAARNDLGAAVGSTVSVSVPARVALGAAVRTFAPPVAGLLVGAGAAQFIAGSFISPEAGDIAAGLGGITGSILGALLGRRRSRGGASEASPLARITRVVTEVDSPADRG